MKSMIRNGGWLLGCVGLAACGTVNTEAPITYVQPCVAGAFGSEQRTLVVTGVISVMTIKYSSGSTCGTPLGTVVSVNRNDLVGQLPVADNPNGVAALMNNMVAVSTTITPTTSTGVATFNNGAVLLCGFSDWALDTAKDVSGRTCGTSFVAAVGEYTYTITRYNGGNLFLYDVRHRANNQTRNGLTDATRIVQIDKGGTSDFVPYVRQP